MVAFLALALLAAPAAPVQQPATPPSARSRAETGERAADARDKMICKRFAQTGSLVGSYRTCKPKSEWDRERDNLRTPGTAGTGCGSPSGGGPCAF